MTLSELANTICTTVSQTEATDLAACKRYLTLRHKMLWQDQMWKDSLIGYERTITSLGYDPTTSVWLPTRQILLVAPIIDQVVAIRTRDHKMGVQSQEYFYCRDLDVFQNQGAATEYVLLAPAVLDFDTAQDLSVLCANAGDIGSILQSVSFESDGITEQEESTSLSTTADDLGSLLTLLSASKPASTGNVIIGNPPAVFIVTNTMTDGSTLSIGVNTVDPSEAQLSLLTGQSGVLSVSVGDNLFVFFNNIFIGPAYPVVNDVGTLVVHDPDMSGNRFAFTASTGANLLTLSAADTAAQKHQRVQIIGGYADGTILRILGKRTCPRFENDNDTPAITGSDNCLIAFAMADMYRRERQIGKAGATAQEGAALMAQLVKEQTAQQAFKKRFVPSDGFGGVDSFRAGGWGGFPW